MRSSRVVGGVAPQPGAVGATRNHLEGRRWGSGARQGMPKGWALPVPPPAVPVGVGCVLCLVQDQVYTLVEGMWGWGEGEGEGEVISRVAFTGRRSPQKVIYDSVPGHTQIGATNWVLPSQNLR